jgi:hypothetical protein
MRVSSGKQMGQPNCLRFLACSALSQLNPGSGSPTRETGGPQLRTHWNPGPGGGPAHRLSPRFGAGEDDVAGLGGGGGATAAGSSTGGRVVDAAGVGGVGGDGGVGGGAEATVALPTFGPGVGGSVQPSVAALAPAMTQAPSVRLRCEVSSMSMELPRRDPM